MCPRLLRYLVRRSRLQQLRRFLLFIARAQHNPNFLDKKSFIGENGSRNNTRADLIDKVELPTFLAAGDRVPQEECNLPTAPVGTWKSAAKTEAKPAS
jgi:hypothetical protein